MVKKNYKRPAMRKLGHGYAYITLSTSNPAQRHITVVLKEPLVMQSGTYDVVCSCMGWTRHKHCWHADEAFMQTDLEVDPVRADLDLALQLLEEYVHVIPFHSDPRIKGLVEKYSTETMCAFCGTLIKSDDQQCQSTEGTCKP